MARHLGSSYRRFYPSDRPEPSLHNRLFIVQQLSLVGQVGRPRAAIIEAMSGNLNDQVVKQSKGLPVRLGALITPPTPIRDVVVDLRIELNEAGPDCLLIQEAQDGSFCWDSWHESVEDAEQASGDQYGVAPSQWTFPDSK
jgi:hypothetical protein